MITETIYKRGKITSQRAIYNVDSLVEMAKIAWRQMPPTLGLPDIIDRPGLIQLTWDDPHHTRLTLEK